MKSRGFTLVELLIVIVVLVILATMTVFFISNWRTDIAETEVKNDLINAGAALDDYRNWHSTYPANQTVFNSIYTNTESVSLSYQPAPGEYCLNAGSKAKTDVEWHIQSFERTPQPGHC